MAGHLRKAIRRGNVLECGEVQLTVHSGSIIITPAYPEPVSKERFEAALGRVVTERREVLRRLAE